MIHPDTEVRLVSPAIGVGVFASRFLPRGTLVWAQDGLDQVFANDHFASLPPVYQPLRDRYCFCNAQGQYVLCWDAARLMNHCCEPNCLGADFGFELAVRDIQPGEELCDDYASLHLQAHESFACLCSSPRCRGLICPEDARRQARAWRILLRRALADMIHVPQPLGPLLTPAQRCRLDRYHGRPRHLPSRCDRPVGDVTGGPN